MPCALPWGRSWRAGAAGSCMLVCTLFVALDVAFPMSVFYLQHCCDVWDPEPTDFYLACQRVGWVILPLLLLGGYCYALRVIP